MRIVTVRRICQVFFLVVFLWFCLAAALGANWWQLSGWPINWLMELGPLTALATVLATGTFAEVTLDFERRRPPLQATDASRALGAHALGIYEEIGQKLILRDSPTAGGTDAAFAALSTKAPVIEGFGLRGFGSHTTNAEYILIPSIEPRLYLATRMIMDISSGKAPMQ